MPSLKQSLVIALVSIVAVAIAKRIPMVSGILMPGAPAGAASEYEEPLSINV